jgi:exosortase A-associated hydrolase 2
VLEAFFLPAEQGRRFCVANRPAREPRGGILYVHPFAEEMHKSRRMAALQARRLAQLGYLVLQIDLLGCGDSGCDFGDARWALWTSDVAAGLRWLRERTQSQTLWGLRLGATLACEMAAGGIERLVLWQPVTNGEQFLTQFLRLRLASEMLAGGAATSALGELRAELGQGRALEVAGYDLHPHLAQAVERLQLAALRPAVKRVDWLEVGAEPSEGLRPGSQRVAERWKAAGIDVRTATVAGEPFWSTIEIAVCEPLLDATTEALRW